MTIYEMLGVKTEEEAARAIQAIAAPPVVITIVRTSLGQLNISCVGNVVSLAEAQNILLDAMKQLMTEEVSAQVKQLSPALSTAPAPLG